MDRQTPVVKSTERYVPQFRQKVLEFLNPVLPESDCDGDPTTTEKRTINAAAKKFNVHKTTISEWIQDANRQKEISLLQQKHDECSLGSHFSKCESDDSQGLIINELQESQSSPLYDQIENKIVDWLSERRADIDSGKFDLTSSQIAARIRMVFEQFQDDILEDNLTKEKLSWLILWFHKLRQDEKEKQSIETTGASCGFQDQYSGTGVSILDCDFKLNSRVKYASKLKVEIVEYTRKLGQRKASRLFQISQKRIYEWIKESNLVTAEDEGELFASGDALDAVASVSNVKSQTCSDSSLGKRKAGSVSDVEKKDSSGESLGGTKCVELSLKSTRQVLDLNVEIEVCEWVQSSETIPTSTEIRNKAIELYRSKGYGTIKCSYGWYRRWAERFKVWASTHDDTDPDVLSWLLEKYDDNSVVSYLNLQVYGLETLKRFRSDFKASPSWAIRFVKRHHIFLNWDGFIEEQLPLILQTRIDDFVSKVRQMNLANFLDDQIGCMDEIPLSFAGSNSKEKDNLDPDVKNISRLRKICLKNCDATAIISLRADGSMLPPMVVVKGQKVCTLNQVYSINDSPVIVFYSKSTEPTISALEKWLELVWLKNSKQPSILFCDSYGLHRQLSAACQEAGVQQEIFPPGCSCKLQPLNVYAKLTFQKLIDNLWEEYLKKNSSESKIKLPSTNEMVEWISLAYEMMKENLHKEKLKTSFTKAGLLTQGRAE